MSIKIDGVSMPENCFRCFASYWYNYGGQVAGFRCGILNDGKTVSNCDGRSKRRDDCPIKVTDGLKNSPLLAAAIAVTQSPASQMARIIGRYQELELKIMAVSGLKLEQILELFAAGYTMERDSSEESMSALSESAEP